MAAFNEELAKRLQDEGYVTPSTVRTWKNRGAIPDYWVGDMVKASEIFSRLSEQTQQYYRTTIPAAALNEWLDKWVPASLDPQTLYARLRAFKFRLT